MKNSKTLLIIASIFLLSCSSESTSDLIDIPNGENISYTDDIKPIVDASCVGCHSQPPISGTSLALNTYESVKANVENDKIIDRISRNQGEIGMMPQGGTRLPDEIINLFSLWKQQGYQE